MVVSRATGGGVAIILAEGGKLSDLDQTAFLVVDEPEGERNVPFSSGLSWSIGRHHRNQIVLSDNRVSRHHAIIQRTEAGGFLLIDMGSRNGTFINENRVSTPAPLHDGDRVSLGGYPLVFRNPVAGPPTAQMTIDVAVTQAWFVQQLVTVLVVDVRDFTHMTQRLEQRVLCEAIGTWFRRAHEITHKYGRSSLKYIGDAVMAVWVHADSNSPETELVRVLTALLEFAAATESVEAACSLPVPMRIGAGVNTGFASVGNTATGAISDYTALGDSVNAAFRLEAATRNIGADVAIGPTTMQALRRLGRADPHFTTHTVNLKGYDTPMSVSAASFSSLRHFISGASAAKCGAS